MEEAGESRGGQLGEGVILTRHGTVRRLYPHPLLHYCQYVPLDWASGSVWGTKPPSSRVVLGAHRVVGPSTH
jgi:hypothetical protein